MSQTTVVSDADALWPRDPSEESLLQGVDGAPAIDQAFCARLHLTAAEAAALDTDGVHAAVTDTGVQVVVTTAITNPPYPRNITATFGGTAGDIKAITVTIAGTSISGEEISEVLPAATVDTAGTVQGSKIFKTVTSITIPAHDGNGATTAIGFGDKIGLPHCLEHDTIERVYIDDVEELTTPTVGTDADEVEKNYVLLDTALAGAVVDIYYRVSKAL